MRISDWSSDVCSSDLPNNHNGAVFLGLNGLVVKSHGGADANGIAKAIGVAAAMVRDDITRRIIQDLDNFRAHEIGRASCRERVCQYVSISVVAVSLKNKQYK